ncbi:hypothetical protein N7490_010406 [Penicillium lividum]|nr:hypothetical protein N7490_010406 [Penicillium lividum]
MENSVLVKPVKINKRGVGKISNSKFTCPLYVMEVGYQEANRGACYMMCFDEGTMTVGFIPSPRKAQRSLTMIYQVNWHDDEDEWFDEVYDMKGWKIAFQLELGLTKLERSHPWFNKLLGQPPPNEKDTLRSRIIVGDYSLNSLVAKFEIKYTALFDLEKSNFNGADILGERDFKENFTFMINKAKATFFNVLHETKTLGYVLQSSAKPEDKPKLNFVPYRIQYQTYPWSNPALEMKTTSGLTGDANLNCLLYLETTDGKELPNERFLPYQGNFTDGRLEATYNSEASEFGAFHMSSRNFFDGYLLKKL